MLLHQLQAGLNRVQVKGALHQLHALSDDTVGFWVQLGHHGVVRYLLDTYQYVHTLSSLM